MRNLTYAQAINEATDQLMAKDPNVFIIGEGVPDPKVIFGTTAGLLAKYGKGRVFDMPLSENGMTGICIGAALRGMRPILVHQRIDFSLLSFDQIANVAAKWHYMFGGQQSVPMVIRMLIGRGWGQGAQHSQSLQAIYGHIPGLKVVMPSLPSDAKGMFISAVLDNNPVIFIEHRWLHNLKGNVGREFYKTPLFKAKILKKGKDVTLVTTSYMTIEGIRAAEILQREGIYLDLIDGRSIKPVDFNTIITSVKKTGKLIVADTGYASFGYASEVISGVSKEAFNYLKSAPVAITLPDIPTSTSMKETEKYYPTYIDIIEKAMAIAGKNKMQIKKVVSGEKAKRTLSWDIPDKSFTGPF